MKRALALPMCAAFALGSIDAIAQATPAPTNPPITGVALTPTSPPSAPTLFPSAIEVLRPAPPPGTISVEGSAQALKPTPPPGAASLTGTNAPKALTPTPPPGTTALPPGVIQVLTPSAPPSTPVQPPAIKRL